MYKSRMAIKKTQKSWQVVDHGSRNKDHDVSFRSKRTIFNWTVMGWKANSWHPLCCQVSVASSIEHATRSGGQFTLDGTIIWFDNWKIFSKHTYFFYHNGIGIIGPFNLYTWFLKFTYMMQMSNVTTISIIVSFTNLARKYGVRILVSQTAWIPNSQRDLWLGCGLEIS